MRIIVFIYSLILFVQSGFAANNLYQGNPEFSKLPKSILAAKFFTHAPKPHLHAIQYRSYETKTGKFYSDYRIDLKQINNHLTRYETHEITGKKYVLVGKGVGYGGIFSMQWLKQGDLARFHHYYKRYQWLNVSNVQGNLFPLKPGNRITFQYNEAYQNTPNGPIQFDHGTIEYRVIREINHFNTGSINIPGQTYEILFAKTTKDSPNHFVPQNTYFFSQYYGWYVKAGYYFADGLDVWYSAKKIT